MEPIQRSILGRELYNRLRDALMLGEFRPGERLTFRDVAGKFNTSVTPVREALLQLVAEGALEASPGRTIVVPVLSQSKFSELTDLRLLLEGYAAERAARNNSKALQRRIRSIYERLLISRNDVDGAACMREHKELHFTLYEAAKMPSLMGLISKVWISTSPYVLYYYSDPNSPFLRLAPRDRVDGHLGIVEALDKDDPNKVRAAIERDIRGSVAIISKYLLKDDQLIATS
jgi:GntR family transcriptional regulator, colanic acid and biofilm gene transcriptional regulator